jgi:hypothetical protein
MVPMKEDLCESAYVTTWLENGVIHFVYKPNLMIDLAIAKSTVQTRLGVTKGIPRPILADIKGMKRVNDEARDYLASEEACQLIISLAVMTNTPIQNLFANFYLKFSKPKMPTQLFTDKAKALRWLEFFKQQKQN